VLPANTLLAKTLTSSTFKLALIAIGAFGVIVSAIFSYVYLSTSAYVRSRSDSAIIAEAASLRDVYAQSGRGRLIDVIRQRTADRSFANHFYLLADPSRTVLAGNLEKWPQADASSGWVEFRAPPAASDATDRPLVRAMLRARFRIDHVTIQVETESCDEAGLHP